MYCARHESADHQVSYTTYNTIAEAEDFAKYALAEDGGGTVEIFGLYRILWANDDDTCHTSMDHYNGVRPGIDYPATLARAVA